MLVTITQSLSIGEHFNFDRFNETVLTDGRQYQPTAMHEPGSPEAAGARRVNALGRITLDDGRSAQNPDPAIHPERRDLRPRQSVPRRRHGGERDRRAGLRLRPVPDPADPGSRLQPSPTRARTGRRTSAATSPSPRSTSSTTSRRWTAAAPTPRRSSSASGQDHRGDHEARRRRRRPDRDREQRRAAIADLVAGLNAASGAGTYAYINTGVIGTDEIKVAFVYKPATVTPVGDHAILDSSVDPRFIDTLNRPALAQTFQVERERGRVHRGRQPPEVEGLGLQRRGDPDTGDGSGNCNVTRTPRPRRSSTGSRPIRPAAVTTTS